jgi:hypothetical protein
MDFGHVTWTIFKQKIFFVNFDGQCPWTICNQLVIPNNPKVQVIIDSNQLEVKKTPKIRGRKLKNATNNVQKISNPAFCILSNIVS